MNHRVFIAINLPEKIKKELSNYQSKWPELPIKWTKPDNLHITLSFLGYISDEILLDVLRTTEELTQKHNSFSVNLNKICYGPPKKMPPRMVWVIGKRSKELDNLNTDLQNSFQELPVKTESNHRSFTPHITLGRINTWEFRQIETEERPQVAEDINLDFEANSIEIMESKLLRGGPEYTILKSFKLKP